MIAPKDIRKERCKQAERVNKPKRDWFCTAGNPVEMGIYSMQNKRKKKKR